MGYLSDHQNLPKKGTIDKPLVEHICISVKMDCINLIIQGYNNYLLDIEKVFAFDEIVITAGLYGQIEKCIDDTEALCKLIPEFPELTDLMKKGKETPKKAKKYDLYFFHFQNKPYSNFGVEAKLLTENNYNSKKANTLITEYVGNAGMGKFINSHYKKEGLMLGYVLGKTDQVVDKINLKVTETYSKSDTLSATFDFGKLTSPVYKSNHTTQTPQLLHIFLDFNNQLTS